MRRLKFVALVSLALVLAALFSPVLSGDGDVLGEQAAGRYMEALVWHYPDGVTLKGVDEFMDWADGIAVRFTAETLAIYRSVARELAQWHVSASGSDFLLVYNPGGLGKTALEEDVQGTSLVEGIRATLEELGYSVSLIEYQRTGGSLSEFFLELRQMLTGYGSKSRGLASRVDFVSRLTGDQKVIITGMSSGALYADAAMKNLKANPAVYCIEAGRPFWYRGQKSDRSLVIRSNGLRPDTLVDGYRPGVALRSLLEWGWGLLGKGLHTFREIPGHEYYWEDPGVGSQIESFLMEHFGQVALPSGGEGAAWQ